MLVNFLLWVKWVLTNAKTVLSFVITLKSAKKCKEWEGPKETSRVARWYPWLLAEQSRSKHEIFYSPSFCTQSWEWRKPESAGKGRCPGCARNPAGLSRSWGQLFPPQSLGWYLWPGDFLKNLIIVCLSRDAQRKPEAGAFCQLICKILKEPWLASMHFTSS